MAALTVWRFDTADGATQALMTLAASDDVCINDRAAVSWQDGAAKPSTELAPHVPGRAALGSGFWHLLFGLIFFVPLLGAAIGASTGALAGSLAGVGIDDGFINKVRDGVVPGTSALFVLTAGGAVDQVHEALSNGEHAELIFTKLTSAQESAVRQVFAE